VLDVSKKALLKKDLMTLPFSAIDPHSWSPSPQIFQSHVDPATDLAWESFRFVDKSALPSFYYNIYFISFTDLSFNPGPRAGVVLLLVVTLLFFWMQVSRLEFIFIFIVLLLSTRNACHIVIEPLSLAVYMGWEGKAEEKVVLSRSTIDHSAPLLKDLKDILRSELHSDVGKLEALFKNMEEDHNFADTEEQEISTETLNLEARSIVPSSFLLLLLSYSFSNMLCRM